MISKYLGFDSDYIIIGLAAVCIILFILVIVNMAQTKKLKKKYNSFMTGKNAKSLEDTLVTRLNQVEKLMSANEANEKNIEKLSNNMKYTFQKVGLVKYDAFMQMGGQLSFSLGGKLSFSLSLLNASNDGFVLNAVHSREGCYTYVKEIIDGNSIIALAEEEQEALNMAKDSNQPVK